MRPSQNELNGGGDISAGLTIGGRAGGVRMDRIERDLGLILEDRDLILGLMSANMDPVPSRKDLTELTAPNELDDDVPRMSLEDNSFSNNARPRCRRKVVIRGGRRDRDNRPLLGSRSNLRIRGETDPLVGLINLGGTRYLDASPRGRCASRSSKGVPLNRIRLLPSNVRLDVDGVCSLSEDSDDVDDVA